MTSGFPVLSHLHNGIVSSLLTSQKCLKINCANKQSALEAGRMADANARCHYEPAHLPSSEGRGPTGHIRARLWSHWGLNCMSLWDALMMGFPTHQYILVGIWNILHLWPKFGPAWLSQGTLTFWEKHWNLIPECRLGEAFHLLFWLGVQNCTGSPRVGEPEHTDVTKRGFMHERFPSSSVEHPPRCHGEDWSNHEKHISNVTQGS